MLSCPTKIKVLIVDDSVTFRAVLRQAFLQIPNVEIVGSASNGVECLEACAKLKPDLITLDVEMPKMNGLEATLHIRQRFSAQVVIISSLSAQGADVTCRALENGAFDFVLKPNSSSPQESQRILVAELTQILETYALSRQKKMLTPVHKPQRILQPTAVKLIAIGSSTGGPNALKTIFERLPSTLRVPVVIIQHMPEQFTKALAVSLEQCSKLLCKEAAPGDVLKPGTAYVAPGNKHLKIHLKGTNLVCALSDEPPEQHCRPSVDYTFRSIADVVKNGTVAAILTGMGQDGTLGASLLKRSGAHIIAQDAASSVVFGMPRSVIEQNLADDILPVTSIADRFCQLISSV